MEPQAASPALVSTERTIAALTWLRTFLSSSTSSASLSASLSAGLEPSPTTVVSIESLRSAIELRASAADAAVNALRVEANACDDTRKTWQTVGANEMMGQLDGDAVQEARVLAGVAAVLGLRLGDALDKGKAVAAAGELAAGLLKDMEDVEERREKLAEAQETLRTGVGMAARAMDGWERATEGVEKRRREAMRMQGKVALMEEKRGAYEERARQQRERVRNAGVEKECRHERVVEMGRRLREREGRMETVEKAVRKFEGLPAVCCGLLYPRAGKGCFAIRCEAKGTMC